MVIWVSTGLAIALPPGKKNSPADEFIPSEPNTEEGRSIPASISRAAGPSAGFLGKPDDLTIDANFRANAPCENRRRAIISRATIPWHIRFALYYRRSRVDSIVVGECRDGAAVQKCIVGAAAAHSLC